ncbi:MAG TPA: VWA domain-containing protein, partial [Thermoanaerobaculia bacterium]|nr:VWA domain-containing protein [Thermoanaerobaculia bacterium]
VTDRKGQPVTGLTKDDFEVYENGQKQELTNFNEIRVPLTTQTAQAATTAAAVTPAAEQASDQPAEQRSRKVILFIDNSALRPFNRNRVIPSMKSFIHKTLRPSDQVMIALWNPGLDIRLQFSNDFAEADKVLDRVTKEGGLGAQYDIERRTMQRELLAMPADYALMVPPEKPPIDIGLAVVHLYATKQVHEQHQAVEAFKALLSSVRGMEGRKAAVFISERLDENPGKVAFDFLDQIKEQFAGGQYANLKSEELGYIDRDLISSVTKLANGSGVTLYPMDATGLGSEMAALSADESGTARYSTPQAMAVPMRTTAITMGAIASATGGYALANSNNFELAFNTIGNDLSSYYSLGFRASGARQDAVRSLTVKLKNPRGLTVRTRQEFIEKSLLSEMNDAVGAHLFFPITRNDLNIRMIAGESKPSVEAEKIDMPVDVKIPTESLTLVPEGTDLTGHFSTYVAFVRKDGAVSKVTRQEQSLRFPADSLKRRKEITVRTVVTTDA